MTVVTVCARTPMTSGGEDKDGDTKDGRDDDDEDGTSGTL